MAHDDNILALYLKDINKIPMLSHEEQSDLADKAQKGDKKAKISNARQQKIIARDLIKWLKKIK